MFKAVSIKSASAIAVLGVSALGLAGCSTPPTRQQTGTAIGAVVGGAVGNAVLGGPVGVLGGAAAGAVVGNEISKKK